MNTNKEELRSLNQELPALYADELEMRLETDPLAIGGFWEEIMPLVCGIDQGTCGIDDGYCGENFTNCGKNQSICGINK